MIASLIVVSHTHIVVTHERESHIVVSHTRKESSQVIFPSRLPAVALPEKKKKKDA